MVSNHRCKECSETFQDKFDFLEHQNVHSGETPFMCMYCGKTFGLIIYYVEHVKNSHLVGAESHKLDSATHKLNGDTQVLLKDINTAKLSNEAIIVDCVEKSKDQVYECLKCSKLFYNSKDLKSHKKEHMDNEVENDKESDLTQSKSKPNTQKHYCKFCDIDLESIKKFKEHKKNLHNFVCDNCNKQCATKEKLAKHFCFFSLANENFKCSCLQIFTKTSDFKKHVGEKPYSCCGCTMQFNTITNLIRHIRTHTKEKPYVCKDCGRGFSQSAHLRNHSSIHLGIRAIQCNECNFSCKTFNGLLKHKKKHRDGYYSSSQHYYIDGRKRSTNTASCPICNKKFLFKRNMGMHMKIHNNKASLCTECGKVFYSKGKLTSHFKACHREPSVCKTCGKVFASAVLLSSHEKIHVSDKLFSCDICSKTFSIKNYLIQHKKTHSNKKQFSCYKCGKLFKVAVSLKYHSKICSSLKIAM